MKKRTAELLVHLATAAAVILGLGLVVYELQLTRQIAFTEMVQEAMSEVVMIETEMLGEEASAVMAKACNSPEALSDAEKMIADSVFMARIQFAVRIKLLEDTGQTETPWLESVEQAVVYIAGFPRGERWLAAVGRYAWDLPFNAAVAETAAAFDGPDCRARLALEDPGPWAPSDF